MTTKTIVCPSCAGINRVANNKLNSQPLCGKCKQPLFNGTPINLTDQNFERFINKTQIPVVVDFWADWCGPCKAMAPAFLQAAKQLEPHYRLAKVNTETAQHIANQYQIRSIPTLMVFKGGKMVAQQAGAMQAGQLVQWVQSI